MTRVTGIGPLSVQNAAAKTIVALEVKVDVNCGAIGTKRDYSRDMIFKQNGIIPGYTLDLGVDFDEARTGGVAFTEKPYIEISTVFVQFDDGSKSLRLAITVTQSSASRLGEVREV
jgi:hypothetical protein